MPPIILKSKKKIIRPLTEDLDNDQNRCTSDQNHRICVIQYIIQGYHTTKSKQVTTLNPK